MVRSQIWDYFTSLSLCLLLLNIGSIFGTVTQWMPPDRDLLSEFVDHAIVFPHLSQGHQRITSTQTTTGHVGAITLTLTAFNVTLTVDLKLNRNLFSSSYIEKHFGEDGRPVLINTTNHHLSHCYYHGRIRNDPHSTAAISTCHGVRGTIVGSHGTYHIEPAHSDINGQHYVFNSIHQRNKNLTCGHNHIIMNGFPYRKKPTRLKRSAVKSWPYDSNSKTRIVEMYVINDRAEYEKYDKDLSQVLKRTKDLVNIVSSLYTAVNIHIALVGIEVWTDKDKIDVVENPDNTMNNFLTYRRLHISQPNDNAQLITGKQLGSGVVGKAPIKTICSWQYSGGVNNDHNLVVGPVATTVAHELGHNFGLSHDTTKCGCPDERCIMAASSGGINNPTKWSECSKQEFKDAFEQGMDYCLRNLPKAISGPALCGNGFLEEGEQCDCGLLQDCNTSCCDPFTCKLTENATCATGACCDLETCQPKKAATVCRPASNQCDLPETCNGKDEFCPDDYYIADGKPCTTDYGSSYCYKGQCHTHEGQCQLLWGRTGHRSHEGCYKHFNTMGQPSGHCGFDWVKTEFTACKPQDVLCGMLHCTHRNEKLMFWKEALAYTMPEGYITITENNKQVRYDCKGAILDVGLYTPDPGMVPDGATCGDNKICVSHHCIELSELDVKKCPDCHGYGVCNNVGECHCDRGHAPPDCNHPGNGGSISGGPTEMNIDNISLIMGLCVFFLIILPLLVVAGYYGYKHRDNLKKFLLRGPAEGYRSIYRAQPLNDIVNHTDRQPAVITTKPLAAVSRPLNNTSAAPLHSHLPNSHHRANVKRASSFRPEDISTPQLESSTKSLTGIPTLRHSVCGTMPANGPMAHTPITTQIVPSRPAPRPPPADNHRQAAGTSEQDSGGFQPSRPPPPKNGFIATGKPLPIPRAQQPLPSLPSDRGHEMSTITEDKQYQNTNHSQTLNSGVEFSDIALDSPTDEGAVSADASQNTFEDKIQRPGAAARYEVRGHGKQNEDNGKGRGEEKKLSSVASGKEMFEKNKNRPSMNRSENKPINKFTAGHPLAESRTNSTVVGSKCDRDLKPTPPARDVKPAPRDVKPAPRNVKPAPRDVKPAPRDVKPAPRDVKPAQRDVRPSGTNKPKPISSKPSISKKPSISATKPSPNVKPVGLSVKLTNSNQDGDNVC